MKKSALANDILMQMITEISDGKDKNSDPIKKERQDEWVKEFEECFYESFNDGCVDEEGRENILKSSTILSSISDDIKKFKKGLKVISLLSVKDRESILYLLESILNIKNIEMAISSTMSEYSSQIERYSGGSALIDALMQTIIGMYPGINGEKYLKRDEDDCSVTSIDQMADKVYESINSSKFIDSDIYDAMFSYITNPNNKDELYSTETILCDLSMYLHNENELVYIAHHYPKYTEEKIDMVDFINLIKDGESIILDDEENQEITVSEIENMIIILSEILTRYGCSLNEFPEYIYNFFKYAENSNDESDNKVKEIHGEASMPYNNPKMSVLCNTNIAIVSDGNEDEYGNYTNFVLYAVNMLSLDAEHVKQYVSNQNNNPINYDNCEVRFIDIEDFLENFKKSMSRESHQKMCMEISRCVGLIVGGYANIVEIDINNDPSSRAGSYIRKVGDEGNEVELTNDPHDTIVKTTVEEAEQSSIAE